jgi:diaminopimelate decarboxylase
MPLHAVFSDSLEELRTLIANEVVSPGTIFGCRLRPATVRSRFGIPVDDYQTFQDLVGLIRTIPKGQPLGIHSHMASSFIGVDSWWNLIETVLEWGRAIESASGRRIECLDLGGGWFPDDWQASLTPRLSRIVDAAQAAFPELNTILLEPGKALAQPSMALAVRVVDVRCRPEGARDVVVDGSIAEMPDMHGYPHRTLFRDRQTGKWTPAARGSDRLLGRLCMEEDILSANLELPEDIARGEVIVFGDAGAYDRSMSYVFGQG